MFIFLDQRVHVHSCCKITSFLQWQPTFFINKELLFQFNSVTNSLNAGTCTMTMEMIVDRFVPAARERTLEYQQKTQIVSSGSFAVLVIKVQMKWSRKDTIERHTDMKQWKSVKWLLMVSNFSYWRGGNSNRAWQEKVGRGSGVESEVVVVVLLVPMGSVWMPVLAVLWTCSCACSGWVGKVCFCLFRQWLVRLLRLWCMRCAATCYTVTSVQNIRNSIIFSLHYLKKLEIFSWKIIQVTVGSSCFCFCDR